MTKRASAPPPLMEEEEEETCVVRVAAHDKKGKSKNGQIRQRI
jgi:hypothetical protein